MKERQNGRWVGTRLPRREDGRMLRGEGRFVDDIAHGTALHAAFVRSSVAHGVIRHIELDEVRALPGVAGVFTAEDIGSPYLRAVLERPEFIATSMPMLAQDKVRFAGEPIVVVLAESRYAAEDACEHVWVDIEELPAVVDLEDNATVSTPVHEEAPDGVMLDLQIFDDPELPGEMEDCALVLEESFRFGRVAASPMEGRACLAEWTSRDEQLVVHISSQIPHQVRSGIATALGLPERCVRVIVPDVGGGFGVKTVLGREEVVVAALAHQLRRAVRWSEDRQEHLMAAFHGHEQRFYVRAGFHADGALRAVDADIRVNVGAYSAYPFSLGVEPLMASTEMPGLYKVGRYSARGRGYTSNKAPTAPYRGVSRPQIVFVMERLMDKAAEKLGLDRIEVRLRNTIDGDDFPYTGPNLITYERGSYREALTRCVDEVEKAGWPVRAADRSDGLLRGYGIINFSERTAFGTMVMGQRQMPMTPGFEVSHLRMDPTGHVTVTSGTLGHGQGHETSFAQIVADRLGIDPGHVKLRQGDTDLVAFGWGTWGSRSLVVGGGAAARGADQLANKLRVIAGEHFGVEADRIVLEDGQVSVTDKPEASMSIADLAALAHFQSHLVGVNNEQLLEGRGSADPPGMFSNAAHAAFVEVDPGTGGVRVTDYIVVEDCGVVVNPLIVDGQVRGGVAQGIAAAIYEEITFSPEGQPQSATYMDYLVPTAHEIPRIAIHHLETPTDLSETGSKGMGEGGTIGAPIAVVTAINAALHGHGEDFDHVPVLPTDVLDRLFGDETREELS
ncbi:MAG: xanthine dehydrogenase [Marmoricola sp.]|nr:xanthine dehydrogenase [Marmoricola sp.]